MCFGSSQQTSTTTQSLDPGLRDRLYGVIDQGVAAAGMPYQPYDAPRIADFTGDQQAGMQAIRNAAGAGSGALQSGIDTAAGIAGSNMAGSLLQPGSYAAHGYDAVTGTANLANRGDIRNVSADQVQGQGLGSVNLNTYMDPYTQSVVDSTVGEINRSYDRTGQQGAANAALKGAFGGDRAAIENAENNRNRATAIGTATGNLMSSGFTNAQQQAQTDLGRQFQGQLANQNANLQAQTTNAGYDASTALANQQAQNQFGLANMSAQNAARQFTAGAQNQADQFNNQLNLQAQQANQQAGLTQANQRLSAAGLLGSLGTQQQGMGLASGNALMGIGAQQQGLDQQNLNLAYQDFTNQRDYPKTQIGWLGSVMNGSAASREGTTTSSAPGPSTVSQIGGLASTGLGLYGLARGAGLFNFADGGMVTEGLGAYADGGAVDWTTLPDDILQKAAQAGDISALREINRRRNPDRPGYRQPAGARDQPYQPGYNQGTILPSIKQGLAAAADTLSKPVGERAGLAPSLADLRGENPDYSGFSGAYPSQGELPAPPSGLDYALGTDNADDDIDVPVGGEVDETDADPQGLAGADRTPAPSVSPQDDVTQDIASEPPMGLAGEVPGDIPAGDGGPGRPAAAPAAAGQPTEGGGGGDATPGWAMPALQFGLNLLAQRGPNALSNIGAAGAQSLAQMQQQKRLDVQDRRQGNVEKRLDRQLALAEGRAKHQDAQDAALLGPKGELLRAQTDAAKALAAQRNTPDAGTTAMTTNINALVKLGVAKSPQEAFQLLNHSKENPYAKQKLIVDFSKALLEQNPELSPEEALRRSGALIGQGMGAAPGNNPSGFSSPADVKAAVAAGKLPRDQALQILRDNFGMK
ncbi:hypothetical protein ABNQ39_00240 (plasmid) [Azospirillum sp. A26]|uniref:hypothetical protein n=1 Tax=Azospirillum sp. A26 TaxID=3160607 RepID=UPI00366DFF5C